MAKQRIQKELRRWRKYFEDGQQKVPPDKYGAKLAEIADRIPLSLVRAGNYFGLKPTDEIESRVLLRVLASILFPKKGRKKGSRHKWPMLRTMLLAFRLEELERAHPNLGDSELARRILTRFPREYDKSLRLQLPRARSLLKKNQSPKWLNELSEQQLRDEIAKLKAGRFEVRVTWDGNPKDADRLAKELEAFQKKYFIKMAEERLAAIEEKQKPSLSLVK